MNEYDAVIVGGGPTGAFTAKKLSKQGHAIAVFEQHKQIGIPMNCAGLVSPRVFQEFSIHLESCVQNTIYGACIHPPSEETLVIGGNKIHAYVIDRTRFDQHLANQAQQHGSQFFLYHKLVSAQRNSKHIDLALRSKDKIIQVQTPLLIGADGPQSAVRKNFFTFEPLQALKGIGAEVVNTSVDPKFVHIFLGRSIAPGFFAWLIPINSQGTTARIGLCTYTQTKTSPKQYLERLLQHKPVKNLLSAAKITTYSGGRVPLGILKHTSADNILLVGDAAAQVKPTSGGGVFSGLRCAEHCSLVAHQAITTKQYGNVFLKQYHKKWMLDIGRELHKGMYFRSVFTRLSDKDFNTYIHKLNKDKIIETINEHGDIDFPSKLILPLMKKDPSFLKLALHLKKKK